MRRNIAARRRLHEFAATALAILALIVTPSLAIAHKGEGVAGGFVVGFLHPILGWDHLAAMVAVGIWGAFLRAPALWLLPIVFPLVMAGGAALGILGVPLPAVEIGIAASAIILGVLVATAARLPFPLAVVIVGAFAIFHGHAHGTELPGSANAMTYALGFVIATGLLHLLGIGFGLLGQWDWGKAAVRAAGGVVALVGVAFLSGVA